MTRKFTSKTSRRPPTSAPDTPNAAATRSIRAALAWANDLLDLDCWPEAADRLGDVREPLHQLFADASAGREANTLATGPEIEPVYFDVLRLADSLLAAYDAMPQDKSSQYAEARIMFGAVEQDLRDLGKAHQLAPRLSSSPQ